jgi:hypothetical protein
VSLCIAVVIPEGIVLAGESRQTQIIAGVNRVASDNAVKVFELTDRIVAATAGWAFIQPQGTALQKNISGVVEDFKATISPTSTVKETATLLWKYFNRVYQEHIAQLPKTAVSPGSTALNFIVAGYDPESSEGTLYSIEIPSTASPTAPVRSTNVAGPWWIGQIDVLARIINGYDFRAAGFPFVKTAMQDPASKALMDGLSYSLFCNTMNVQDAIDFAVEMIRVTITIQRFTAGIMSNLGAVAGVGGPIDVVVVQPRQRVMWVSRKTLHP